ncbi:hypothetical protein I6L27_05585 [Acinetobacter pittii]|uniref:hypothetical protein n=1 Tax=Acinetobacter pittii TaxID=48296 RepID=UPI001C21CB26|nr:hypothetical protein [Acinetobacter pittii]QXA09013.1 hypothetical protein I6L27_05585 [Acinetobacter pittii]
MVFLEITMKIALSNRPSAAEVYQKFKGPFLDTIKGAKSKHLLIREEDVQVLHGFNTLEDAQNYLGSELFTQDVVTSLQPFFEDAPDIRIYQVA